MATTVAKPSVRPVCDSPDVCCPNCGALECLCRPRFFAGQLLSEQDLNRLDQYIKNKNRLHNRNQHGWGVVNGMLVLCDPCGTIKVTEGYAVDPCGDDIVICEETGVDICDLISRCRTVVPPDCEPFRQPPNVNCEDLEEEWVLTVEYKEWATRGVTALRGSSCAATKCSSCGGSSCACGASCGCGKTGAGGCQCGTAKPAMQTHQTATGIKNRGAPPECEPTVTCEGYSFGVYQKPVEDPKDDNDERLFDLEGAFWDNFNCCAEPLLAAIPPMPDLSDDGEISQAELMAVTKWCCQFRDALIAYFSTHRHTNCELIDYLNGIVCPNANNMDNFANDFIRSFLQLIAAWAEGLKICLCLSLLPPAVISTCDPRVPLATVRVRKRDCKVLSVCNWTTERKMMVTWPSFAYWLGIVPIVDIIRELMDRVCCSSLLGLFDGVLNDVRVNQPITDAGPGNAESAVLVDVGNQSAGVGIKFNEVSGALAGRFRLGGSTKIAGFKKLAGALAIRGNQPLDLGAVLNAVSPRFSLPDNGKTLTSIEAKNLPMVLISEIAIKPALATAIGPKEAEVKMREFERSLDPKRKTRSYTETGDVREQLAELRSTLDKQANEIATLRARLKQ